MKTNSAEILKMDREVGKGKKSYWDARWGTNFIEFKKGRSIWLDLVRYSRALLQFDEHACHEVVSLFFVPNKAKTKIEEIICVETCDILAELKLAGGHAHILVNLKQDFSSLNARVSLTVPKLKTHEKLYCRGR